SACGLCPDSGGRSGGVLDRRRRRRKARLSRSCHDRGASPRGVRMTAKADAKTARIPWSHPVRRDDVPETGLHIDLVADEATRAAVADAAGVPALRHLAATFDLTRQGDGLKVTGEVAAAVAQT